MYFVQKESPIRPSCEKSRRSREILKLCPSRSKRAGIKFSARHLERKMAKYSYKRIDEEAPIFLGAILEYLVTKVIWMAGTTARMEMSSMIHTDHLRSTLKNEKVICNLLTSGNN